MDHRRLDQVLGACTSLLDVLPVDGVAAYVAACHLRIAACLGSRAGYVVISVRAAPDETDLLCGFRPDHAYIIGERDVVHTAYIDVLMRDDARLAGDPVFQRIARDHGRHRIYHDPDPRGVPGLEASYDALVWTRCSLSDRIKAAHSIDRDHELHIGFDRPLGQAPFSDEDEALFAAINVAIAPWARRVMLLHGYGPGLTPLSPRDRATLCLLFGDTPQKNHAVERGLSDARARELVRDLYRKLGVGSRSELMARWFSAGPPAAAPITVAEMHLARRRRSRPPLVD